ncbi:MAG: biotin/lipoyl-containing protein [Myxococcota bacterium]
MTASPTDPYSQNPLVHKDRRLGRSDSAWVRSFACEDMSILIVCRGPVRKEAMDTFGEMGVRRVGILLSEKDSIVYTNALAPELRFVSPQNIHRVKDYTGANREEREAVMAEIVDICLREGYGYVFAGYGFMAEDETFVATIEKAGLRFIGPRSATVRSAGRKDEAKRTALEQKVSVTPGVQNLTGRTLLARAPSIEALRAEAERHELSVNFGAADSAADCAELVLDASYSKGIDLITVDEISEQLVKELISLYREHPGRRVRLKAIGGGGGKGQRILQAPKDPSEAAEVAAQAPEKFREILSEVKAGGVGDNKNVLLELNIESTRHHEIQLIGNGTWCLSLGGRDCSLQMHEQKLLEVSITQEALREASDRAHAAGRPEEGRALATEFDVLSRMEAEAERFGLAVGLDSASTFECIVDGARHYFMEVNTRIQVEHRVSELCYALRFTNPQKPGDFFDVPSIVEAMALIARHKARLPRPARVRRSAAAVEARLNATDRSLNPHAGGIIEYWSDPVPGEIRDDQGISAKNPDTGQFIRYRLAGAYDSNVALLVTVGGDRDDSYRRLQEVLRCTKLEGVDLATNLDFHFGLVNFFLGTNVHAKPTTRFVVPYLTQVGLLKEQLDQVDLERALVLVEEHHVRRLGTGDEQEGDPSHHAVQATRAALELKKTLIQRPLALLAAEPHILSGWLSAMRGDYALKEGRVEWLLNPVRALRHGYHVLNMSYREDLPAANMIWDHDRRLLETACNFYDELERRLDLEGAPWPEVRVRLETPEAPAGFDDALWRAVREAHLGHQLGLEMFDILPLVAERAGFYEMKVHEDLTVTVPERLHDPELQKRMQAVLVPPPKADGNEIVAVTGGMFYAREAPDRPPLVEVGTHFNVGDPLYVVEVMKMFNKVPATFSGTITDILIETDGTIVKKGQPLFLIDPDVAPDSGDDGPGEDDRRAYTEALMAEILA